MTTERQTLVAGKNDQPVRGIRRLIDRIPNLAHLRIQVLDQRIIDGSFFADIVGLAGSRNNDLVSTFEVSMIELMLRTKIGRYTDMTSARRSSAIINTILV